MGECYLVKSGGIPLNFTVVGGTIQPVSPKENSIWVNTDKKITGWAFSAVEPTQPIDGVVWFSTGTSSTVEFNALKKNSIQVYPLSAKQYVGGAWVDVTAKSFQNGAWTDWWDGRIINGASFPDNPFGVLAINKTGVAAYAESIAELSQEKNCLYTYWAKANAVWGTVYLTPKMDLTSFSTLTVRWKAHGTTPTVGFFESLAEGSTQQTFVASGTIEGYTDTLSPETVTTVDISGLDGEYTFGVCNGSSNYGNGYTAETYIYEVILS